MTNTELATLLKEKAIELKLKELAFHGLDNILNNSDNDDDLLCGYERGEITPTFLRYDFLIGNKLHNEHIRTRIALYAGDIRQEDMIGYYDRETDFEGIFFDDWFVILREKNKSAGH